MEVELMNAAAEFGAAGLIGCMWLLERRAAAVRERQLTEAHEHIRADRVSLANVVGLIESNTRAVTLLESTQSRLVSVLDRRRDDSA